MNIVLASSSPRRANLLKKLDINFIKKPVSVNEKPLVNEKPENYVQRISEEKAKKASVGANGVIIAADTIVWKNGNFLGKPSSKEQAIKLLSYLSDTYHFVFTGITILDKRDNSLYSEYSKTKVYFYPLSEQEMNLYIQTGEPMDKAGAYGIQGFGGLFIKSIKGSYYNVVGFPIDIFYNMMLKIGINILEK